MLRRRKRRKGWQGKEREKRKGDRDGKRERKELGVIGGWLFTLDEHKK